MKTLLQAVREKDHRLIETGKVVEIQLENKVVYKRENKKGNKNTTALKRAYEYLFENYYEDEVHRDEINRLSEVIEFSRPLIQDYSDLSNYEQKNADVNILVCGQKYGVRVRIDSISERKKYLLLYKVAQVFGLATKDVIIKLEGVA